MGTPSPLEIISPVNGHLTSQDSIIVKGSVHGNIDLDEVKLNKGPWLTAVGLNKWKVVIFTFIGVKGIIFTKCVIFSFFY